MGHSGRVGFETEWAQRNTLGPIVHASHSAEFGEPRGGSDDLSRRHGRWRNVSPQLRDALQGATRIWGPADPPLWAE